MLSGRVCSPCRVICEPMADYGGTQSLSLATITTRSSITSGLGLEAGSCIDCFEYLPNAGTRPASRLHTHSSKNLGSRAFHNILPITTRSRHPPHPNPTTPRIPATTSPQQNIPDMLPLKPDSIQPPNPRLPPRLLGVLPLLGELLHRLGVRRLVPRRRVVVLVEVDLA